MDLIHRLNPFHHRPPSSLRTSNTPTPTPYHQARPSSSLEDPSVHSPSIDSTLPSCDEGALALPSGDYHTSPRRGHHRTPSILRTLAHHPSLSALKSKSKRKKRKEIPPLPEPFMLPKPSMEGGRLTPSEGRESTRLRKKSLKGSKSVPRDMRLSNSSDSEEQEDVPPLPLPRHTMYSPAFDTSQVPQQGQARPRAYTYTSRSSSASPIGAAGLPMRVSSIRRKPAPTATPDLLLASQTSSHAQMYRAGSQSAMGYNDFATPESMRVRMRFEVDLATEALPARSEGDHRNEYGLGLGTPVRRRYLSFDERSPGRPQIAARHLSSPSSPDASPSRPQATSSQHTGTGLSPQANLYAQSLYADSTTFFSPVAQGVTPHVGWAGEDGLDMFVRGDVPPGTPGGKKEDLRRGCFVDGAKHEKDAVRFFSRDMYELPSGTPSPSTSPSTAARHSEETEEAPHSHHISGHKQVGNSPARSLHRRATSPPAASPARKIKEKDFCKAAKRSSSPFEVKLVPSVTKRMSLDAFGTTPVPPSDEGHETLEEVLDNVWIDRQPFADDQVFPKEVHDGEDDEDDLSFDDSREDVPMLDSGGLDAHQSHHLSTIEEFPSSFETSAGDIPSFSFTQQTPVSRNSTTHSIPGTRFYTPLSPSLNAEGFPASTSYSPSPLAGKRMSAPPFSLPHSHGQGITRSLLDVHVEHAQSLQEQLRVGSLTIEALRSEVNELKQCLLTVGESKETMSYKLVEQEDKLDELQKQCKDKELALDQLRQAVVENEEFFDNLQDAHDDLAEQVAALNEARLSLEAGRGADVHLIDELKADLLSLHSGVEVERATRRKAEEEKKELESVVFELRRELKWTEGQVEEKDQRVFQLFNSGSESGEALKEAMRLLEVEREASKVRDEKIGRLEHELEAANLDREDQLTALQEEIVAARSALEKKDDDFASLGHDLAVLIAELEQERVALSSEALATKEKDDIILYLRELLASEQSASKDRQITLMEKERSIVTLEQDLLSVETELKAARSNVVDRDAEIDGLRQDLSVARYEKNERHFASLVEIDQLREQVEELTRSSAEYEWAAREGGDVLARLMEEKRVWEEERGELIEMINHNSLDADSAANLRAKVDQLTESLGSTERAFTTLRRELDDAESSVAHKNTLIHAQDAELSALRLTLSTLEDKLAESTWAFERQSKDHERISGRLRDQVAELDAQLSSHDNALRSAVVEAESTKASSRDHASRIERYLTEIDELKLSETKLRSKLEEAQRYSASGELRFSELEKKVKGLEEDKELLNVALESKTMELALLQRRDRKPSTPSTRNGMGMGMSYSTSRNSISTSTMRTTHAGSTPMSKSTSRIPPTPTPMTGLDNTPLPRRLATSTSAVRARRETISTGTATASAGARVPLGGTSRHNKVSSADCVQGTVNSEPEGSKKPIAAVDGTSSWISSKKVERRSSLPVLRRPSTSLGLSTSLARRESLVSIDEDR